MLHCINKRQKVCKVIVSFKALCLYDKVEIYLDVGTPSSNQVLVSTYSSYVRAKLYVAKQVAKLQLNNCLLLKSFHRLPKKIKIFQNDFFHIRISNNESLPNYGIMKCQWLTGR